MDVPPNDFEWSERQVGLLVFHTHIGRRQGRSVLTVLVGMKEEVNQIWNTIPLGQYSVQLEDDDPLAEIGTEILKDLSAADLSRYFGISVNAERFFKPGQTSMVEWRFRLMRRDETYIGVVSAEDHWQGSHSHDHHTESSHWCRARWCLLRRYLVPPRYT